LKSAKRLWVDEVRSGSSYNSSSDLRLHFGLGTETHLTTIQIRWPNGKLELFDSPATVDQMIELVEGKGHSSPPPE
jgi:enediyne biosynthesis protein E4